MTTATRTVLPGSTHNGTEHNDQDDRVEHGGGQESGAAATDAAFALIVAEAIAAALTETAAVAGEVAAEIVAYTAVAVESAAGTARELMAGGVGTAVRKAAGLTVDVYQRATTQQLALAATLADAVPVDWVSKLTRRNAETIEDLVMASAGAAHELLD